MNVQNEDGSKTYDAGFYALQSNGSLRSARIIVPMLLSHISPRSVIDVGCGIGTWLKAFQENGTTDVLGLDGEYVRPGSLLIDPSLFRPSDLREDQPLLRTFDLALSLEVAEHLPERHASLFVRRLVDAAPAVLFAAAIPGQGGIGHLNEQWQDYWRDLFLEHDYHPVDVIRPLVRGLTGVEVWYQANIILYCDAEYLAAHPNLTPLSADLSLNQVHPTLYDDTRRLYFTKALKMLPALAREAIERRLKHIMGREPGEARQLTSS